MYFAEQEGRYAPTNKIDVKFHDKLPPGNYALKLTPMGYFFEPIERFKLPSKLYGRLPEKAQRIMTTFNKRSSSTGVALSGEAGAGKTLLAKMLGVACYNEGMAVIVITEPHTGGMFAQLVQAMEQPVMFLFDEFEKVYDEDAQQGLLTILDGAYNSKKLFVLTCNDEWKIDTHMRNRPGRLYYWERFNGLDSDFIKEYSQDHVKIAEHIEPLCTLCSLFPSVNFDMLQAMIEEMNRYGETPIEATQMLNVTLPYAATEQKYILNLELVNDGSGAELIERHKQIALNGHPLTLSQTGGGGRDIHVSVPYVPAPGDDEDDVPDDGMVIKSDRIAISHKTMIGFNQKTGELAFEFLPPSGRRYRGVCKKEEVDYRPHWVMGGRNLIGQGDDLALAVEDDDGPCWANN